MKKEQQTLGAVASRFTKYLTKVNRRPATIEKYEEIWNRMGRFISSNKITFFDKSVGERFLKHLYGNYDYYQLKRHPKNIVNCVEALSEFQQTCTIARGPRKRPIRTF